MKQRFVLRNEEIRERAIRSLLDVPVGDHLCEVVIRPYKKDRSLEQNAYLWAMHQAASSELGHTANELHAICCRMILGTRTIGEVEIPVTTTCGYDGETLSVAEMADFLTSVEELYLSMGVRLDKVYGEKEKATEQQRPA